MSEHGAMPRSAWVYPALAVLLFAAQLFQRANLVHNQSGTAFTES